MIVRSTTTVLIPVEADLQSRVFDETVGGYFGERFIAANEKTQELVRDRDTHQRSPGFQGRIKRAQSDLMSRLMDSQDRARERQEVIQETRDKDDEAELAQHLGPGYQFDSFLRYETASQRQLYRALAELERIQLLRREGSSVSQRRLDA
jgi:hypothetical protein